MEIDSSPGNAWGIKRSAHSVLTEDLVVDEPDHPTRHALDQVLELFRTRLRAGSGSLTGQRRSARSQTRPPVAFTSSEGRIEKFTCGVPAAAHSSS